MVRSSRGSGVVFSELRPPREAHGLQSQSMKGKKGAPSSETVLSTITNRLNRNLDSSVLFSSLLPDHKKRSCASLADKSFETVDGSPSRGDGVHIDVDESLFEDNDQPTSWWNRRPRNKTLRSLKQRPTKSIHPLDHSLGTDITTSSSDDSSSDSSPCRAQKPKPASIPRGPSRFYGSLVALTVVSVFATSRLAQQPETELRFLFPKPPRYRRRIRAPTTRIVRKEPSTSDHEASGPSPADISWPHLPKPRSPISSIDQVVKPLDDSVVRQLSQHPRRTSHSRPRVFALDDAMLLLPPKHRSLSIYPTDFTDPTQLYGQLDSSDERIRGMEPWEAPPEECVPMHEWQTTYHPSCNGMHELALERMGDDDSNGFALFGTKGFWRNAWKVDVANGAPDRDRVVLKTLKIRHNFEAAHFEHDRIDAVAMERLTASPHVIDIFGFCGHSVISEFADGSRLGSLADKAKKKPLERLKIARDIADGLADVHAMGDSDDVASFVHLDVNPANVVSINGRLKLNDFNIGILRRWNTTSGEACGFPSQYPNPQWRSPEESRNDQNLTEKVDVFSLGHILFRLIAGHEPWNYFEPNGRPPRAELLEKVASGELPTIPTTILESSDPEEIAIRDAMLGCYTADPTQRPSARSVALSLQEALDRLS